MKEVFSVLYAEARLRRVFRMLFFPTITLSAIKMRFKTLN